MDRRLLVLAGVLFVGLCVWSVLLFLLFTPEFFGTQKGCVCVNSTMGDITGDVVCNEGTGYDVRFASGIVNVVETCSLRQIAVCREGERIDTAYVETGGCSLDWYLFMIPLNGGDLFF